MFSNSFPWSWCILEGKPKRMMKSSNSFLAAVFPDLPRVAYAYAYLVKWSTMTSMYSSPPLHLSRCTKSMKIISNGAVVSMLCIDVLVILFGFFLLIQRHTRVTKCSISCLTLGQKKRSLARSTILSAPRCPNSLCLYMTAFIDSGTTSCVFLAVSLLRMPSPSTLRCRHSLRRSRADSFSPNLSLCFRLESFSEPKLCLWHFGPLSHLLLKGPELALRCCTLLAEHLHDMLR